MISTTEAICLVIIFFLVLTTATLAYIIIDRYEREKLLLNRRSKRDKDKPEQQAEENICSRQCALFCSFEENVIPELQSEIQYWQDAHKEAVKQCAEAENRNLILQSTIAKLRTGREDKQ